MRVHITNFYTVGSECEAQGQLESNENTHQGSGRWKAKGKEVGTGKSPEEEKPDRNHWLWPVLTQ